VKIAGLIIQTGWIFIDSDQAAQAVSHTLSDFASLVRNCDGVAAVTGRDAGIVRCCYRTDAAHAIEAGRSPLRAFTLPGTKGIRSLVTPAESIVLRLHRNIVRAAFVLLGFGRAAESVI